MPRLKNPSSLLPGEDASNPFVTEISIKVVGLEDFGITSFSGSSIYLYAIESTDPPAICVAIRREDGCMTGPDTPARWACATKSFEESERYAKALSRAWYLQVLTFDHVQTTKKGRFSFAHHTFVYRATTAYSLIAEPSERNWTVVRGPSIQQPSPSNVQALGDRWDDLCSEIEKNCDIFHRVAASLPDNTLRVGLLAGPAKSTEELRVEARRLSAIGQNLEKVSSPDDTTAANIARTWDSLEDVGRWVLAGVNAITDIQLNIPVMFPNIVTKEGTLDLAAIKAMTDEKAATAALFST